MIAQTSAKVDIYRPETCIIIGKGAFGADA